MAKLLITYDLNQPGRDYARIIGRIKQYPNWCHALESLWFVISDAGAAAVRDDLMTYVDSSTKILVIDTTGDFMAWTGLSTEVSEWLKNH
jgi:hypothetical protein